MQAYERKARAEGIARFSNWRLEVSLLLSELELNELLEFI